MAKVVDRIEAEARVATTLAYLDKTDFYWNQTIFCRATRMSNLKPFNPYPDLKKIIRKASTASRRRSPVPLRFRMERLADHLENQFNRGEIKTLPSIPEFSERLGLPPCYRWDDTLQYYLRVVAELGQVEPKTRNCLEPKEAKNKDTNFKRCFCCLRLTSTWVSAYDPRRPQARIYFHPNCFPKSLTPVDQYTFIAPSTLPGSGTKPIPPGGSVLDGMPFLKDEIVDAIEELAAIGITPTIPAIAERLGRHPSWLYRRGIQKALPSLLKDKNHIQGELHV